MSEIENRYKALIQPIKDIAANWDIDIAESLTEYLEELDHLRISIDGGKSNLNFAEAALLIQGSTAVYSKKVEYLHQLVLQSLEFITNKKPTASGITANGKVSKTIDDEDILLLDNDASFLLLDHIVEEGHNINLKTSAPNLINRRNSRNSNSYSSENNTSRVSMSLMHSILSDDQGSASLKLSTSLVDGSGALLLCGSYPTSSTASRFQPGSRRTSLQNSFQESSFLAEPPISMHDGDMYGDDAGDDWGGGNGDDYDGDNGHGDGEEPTADPFPYADTSEPMVLGTPVKGPPPVRMALAGAPNTAPAPVPAPVPALLRRAAPVKDMYAQLDPHQAVTTSREARRGKTYKIPAVLLKPPANPNPAEARLEHLYLYADNNKPTHASTFLRTGAVPAKGLFDSSLLPILQMKRKIIRQARMATIRAGRTAVAGQVVHEDGSVTGAELPEQFQNLHLTLGQQEAAITAAAAANTSRVEELWSQDYEDYGDTGGDYGGGGDDFDGQDDAAGGGGGGSAGGLPDSFHGETAGDAIARGAGEEWAEESEEEALARRVANVLNEEFNQSSTRTSYESICQKYIDNFNQGAHLFAKETQLSRRVAEWTQRLEPILQQQEEAAQYDIHAYCETFLEGVEEAIEAHDQEIEELEAAGVTTPEEALGEVGFGDVVAGQSSAEVCRIFLACLQLVNQGSLSITPAANMDQWSFSAPTAGSAVGGKKGSSSKSPNSANRATTSSFHPFRIRRIAFAKASRVVNDIENYRAPSLNSLLPPKGALKSAMSGKGKGTKRVFMDMPSNITITI